MPKTEFDGRAASDFAVKGAILKLGSVAVVPPAVQALPSALGSALAAPFAREVFLLVGIAAAKLKPTRSCSEPAVEADSGL